MPSPPSRPCPKEDGLLDHPAPAAFLSSLPIGLGHRLPRRDHHQQPPDFVAVRQLGKLAPRSPGAETVERAQGRVFLVLIGRRPSHAAAASCAPP